MNGINNASTQKKFNFVTKKFQIVLSMGVHKNEEKFFNLPISFLQHMKSSFIKFYVYMNIEIELRKNTALALLHCERDRQISPLPTMSTKYSIYVYLK